jgi:hypothetical protein
VEKKEEIIKQKVVVKLSNETPKDDLIKTPTRGRGRGSRGKYNVKSRMLPEERE